MPKSLARPSPLLQGIKEALLAQARTPFMARAQSVNIDVPLKALDGMASQLMWHQLLCGRVSSPASRTLW